MCDRFARVCTLLLFTLNPIAVSAQTVYRCPQPDGRIQFQQFACEQGVSVRLAPSTSGWTGLRPEENAALKKGRQSASSSDVDRRRGSQTDWQSGGDSVSCRQRRARLDKARSKLRKGYKASEGERLRRQRDEDRAWLNRHC